MSTKILSLSAFDICPPRSGGALRTTAINRGLGELGWEVTQYVAFPSLSQRFLHASGPSRSPGSGWQEQHARGVALKPLAWLLNHLRLPPLAADLGPRGLLLEPALRALLDEADVVIAEHPWLFRALYGAGGRKETRWVLDAHNIEYPLYAARAAGPIGRRAASRLRDLEAFAFRQADLALVVCDQDAAAARDHYAVPAERLWVAPNGVDCTALQPVTEAERQARKRALGLEDGPVALFVGADWPPNVEAAREILRLAAELADTPLQFVIAGAVGQALQLDATLATVRVTGPVDDIRPWLEAADLALNPMRSGGGSNIKLLEYLAFGLPTISTPFGARGLDLVAGEQVMIVPLEGFGPLLCAAADPRQRAAWARLGRTGRSAVEARFDWGQILAGVDAALARCLASRCLGR
ncbi:glycosyltransferase family 4 protein [uncultured Thiohalocapsa sp.]|mgnify:CR=1 FL=1|uniref:glycosyltransferase family 4 protein n=1 Tax=uncultured Thiohalocapsa sp. TaxID=768990 RepID=UPI0025DC8940|nr:glycosyltransferase family 4 protein [uncultured Thiohalocapsa sp.]